MDVPLDIDSVGHRLNGCFDGVFVGWLANQRLLDGSRSVGLRAYTSHAKPSRSDLTVLQRDQCAYSGEGVVTRWLIELLVGRAGPSRLRPQSHFANDFRGEQLE